MDYNPDMHDIILAHIMRVGKDAYNQVEFYDPVDVRDENSNARAAVWWALQILCNSNASSFRSENVESLAQTYLAKHNIKDSSLVVSHYVEMLADTETDDGDFVATVHEFAIDLQARKQREILAMLSEQLAKPLRNDEIVYHDADTFRQTLLSALDEWENVAQKGTRIINLGEQKEVRKAELEVMHERFKNGETSAIVGVTGFSKLDAVAPIMPSQLGIIAGPSGKGKTSLVLNMLTNLHKEALDENGNMIKIPVKILLVSLEMTPFEINTKLNVMNTFGKGDVSFAKIVKGHVDHSSYVALTEAMEEQDLSNIYMVVMGRAEGNFDTDGISYSDRIIATVGKAVSQYGVELVVVDHAQLLNSDESKSPAEVRKLAAYFNQLGIASIILNQVNKSEDSDINKMTQNSIRFVNPMDAAWAIGVDADKGTGETVIKSLKLRFGDDEVAEGDMFRYGYDRRTGKMLNRESPPKFVGVDGRSRRRINSDDNINLQASSTEEDIPF